MSLGDAMKIIELRSEIEHLHRQVSMYHNGMIDITIMLEEDDIDEAKARAASFISSPTDSEEET